MLAIPIPQIYDQHYVPAVIGNVGLVLHNEYDPEQMWLPFMVNAIMKVRVPPKSYENYRHNTHIAGRKPVGGTYAKTVQGSLELCKYTRGIEQHVLPFVEHQNISKKVHSNIAKADYPCWDRIHDKPITIPILPEHCHAVKQWCAINCTGRFHVKQKMLYLQKAEDAMMATVLWRAPRR